MKIIIPVIFACIMTVISAGLEARAGVMTPDLKGFLRSLDTDSEVAVIVTLTDRVDLKQFKDKNKKVRRNRIIKALKDKSEKTQKNIIKYLQRNKVKKITPFWIFNGLAVTAGAHVLEELAAMDGVESISLDATLSLPDSPVINSVNSPAEWNINAIHAPELWSLGYTGKGIVLASMDTGVDYLHPDLADKWRGGANSWFDPHGEHPATPYDAFGHGTQVMGVLIGGDAGGTAIGVAPGARWISVKIFDDARLTSYSIIHDGFQWLMDPDENPDTDDAPDVINNSWGFAHNPGECLIINQFAPDIEALKAAGIGIVFSAGNSHLNESPANYPESFAVGAVNQEQIITYESGRGPSACDGTVFPELVAPGVHVLSTDLTINGAYPDSYTYVSGTSIAAPHVAGAMGLLLSAEPYLSIGDIESALTASALDLGASGPDNDYGYGFLDVLAAFRSLPPIARNDIVTTARNKPVTINILANDVATQGSLDVESVILRLNSTTVRGATVEINGGVVTYTPEGAGGPDYFYYTVKDGRGQSSNEATVRINRVRAN